MEGIGPARIEELLRAAPGTLQDKRAALRKGGLNPNAVSYADIVAELIKINKTVEDAFYAALVMWSKWVDTEDVNFLLDYAASKNKKKYSWDDIPGSVHPFFKADGDLSRIGEIAILAMIEPNEKIKKATLQKPTAPAKIRLQGGPEHRQIQKCLVDLGESQHYIVKTDYLIGGSYKPDVLWFRLDPDEHPKAGAHAVFEIESVGAAQALDKSLGSLSHSYHLWGGCKLYLIAPKRRHNVIGVKVGAEGKLNGSYHDIRDLVTVISLEEIPREIYKLGRFLKIY